MARSFKKVCAGAMCCGSDTVMKQHTHGATRARSRDLLHLMAIGAIDQEVVLPLHRELVDVYSGGKDGKSRYHNPEFDGPAATIFKVRKRGKRVILVAIDPTSHVIDLLRK
jgi:hypothetical protein